MIQQMPAPLMVIAEEMGERKKQPSATPLGGDAGQSCAQSGGKVPSLRHSWLYSGGLEQWPGALHTMASIKQHHQHHCYLLLPPSPSPGAIRLANLEGDKTP